MPQDDYRLLRGDYSVYRFTDQIYKVVKFKSNLIPIRESNIDKSQFNKYDSKLDNSLSRTRRLILEKALCNPWSHFATLTIDPNKYDRYNLHLFYKSFSQWLRDKRKQGFDIKYLLVPELHNTDNSWHLHGLFYGLPPLMKFSSLINSPKKIPLNLLYSDFEFWEDYQEKFGFCSFGLIRSPVRSAFYISKYITKDHNKLVSSLGSKMFYCSQGLNTPSLQMEVYGSSPALDEYLQEDYDFCSVGMTKISDGLSWDFALEHDNSSVPLFDSKEHIKSNSFFDGLSSLNLDFEQLSVYDQCTG